MQKATYIYLGKIGLELKCKYDKGLFVLIVKKINLRILKQVIFWYIYEIYRVYFNDFGKVSGYYTGKKATSEL